jgi:hypothetical protein
MSLLQRCTRFNFKTPQTPNPKFPRACLFQKDASILVTPATSSARQLRQCASPKEVLNAASAVCGCLAANNARSAPRTRPHCVLASGAPTLTHGACLPFSHARSPTMRAQPYVLASRAPTLTNGACSPAVLQRSPTVRACPSSMRARQQCAFNNTCSPAMLQRSPTVRATSGAPVLTNGAFSAAVLQRSSPVRVRQQYSNGPQPCAVSSARSPAMRARHPCTLNSTCPPSILQRSPIVFGQHLCALAINSPTLASRACSSTVPVILQRSLLRLRPPVVRDVTNRAQDRQLCASSSSVRVIIQNARDLQKCARSPRVRAITKSARYHQ